MSDKSRKSPVIRGKNVPYSYRNLWPTRSVLQVHRGQVSDPLLPVRHVLLDRGGGHIVKDRSISAFIRVVTGLMKTTSRHNGTCSAHLSVFLGHGDTTFFHLFESLGRLMPWQILSTRTYRRATDMDKRQLKGVVHLKLFIGVQHLSHLVQHLDGMDPVLPPFPRRQTPKVKSVAQTVRGHRDVDSVTVVNDFVF